MSDPGWIENLDLPVIDDAWPELMAVLRAADKGTTAATLTSLDAVACNELEPAFDALRAKVQPVSQEMFQAALVGVANAARAVIHNTNRQSGMEYDRLAEALSTLDALESQRAVK